MPKTAVYVLLLALTIYGCSGKSASAHRQMDEVEYQLDEQWPELPPGYILGQPTGIGIDSKENIFVFHRAGRKWTTPFPDSLISANTILALDNKTGKILNSWGANLFILPHGLTVDKDDNVWVTDVALQQIFKFNSAGQLLMKVGVAREWGDDSLHFNLPTDVAVADDGSFYVSDGYGNSRVVKFSPSGTYLFQWGTHGSKVGEFDIPHGITLDHKSNVYVADRENNRIQVFDSAGIFLKEVKNNESVSQLPSVTIDHSQNLFAIDYDFTIAPNILEKGSTILKYNDADSIEFHLGATGKKERTTSWFHDISVDSQGNIYVGDISRSKVLKFKPKTSANQNSSTK